MTRDVIANSFINDPGLTGFEPATSAVTGRCSNQLNYKPNFEYLGERGIRTLGTKNGTID
jgi:hypothetical protein